MIGAVQVPLGIAGPLAVRFAGSAFRTMVPLATTEGALVASVNRGCKAISSSGGADVVVERAGVTRGPVFDAGSLLRAHAVKTWIETHKEELADITRKTSTHATLTGTLVRIAGNMVFVRLAFDTSDAMGMNMATVAATAVCARISEATDAKTIAVAGNFDVDKKPSWLNAIEGRGRRVWAQTVISEAEADNILKTTPEAFAEVWQAKCMLGSALSGSMGFNAHMANVLAALYLATGQDPAHVAEGSQGIVTTNIIPDSRGLSVSVYIPDVMVGVIGGGTGLETQRECLGILGITEGTDGTQTDRLAAIVGAAVLAGEISLLASLAEGTLSRAHERLARGKHT